MPDSMTPTMMGAKNSLHQTNPWVWLVKVDLDGTNGLFANDGDAPITYGGEVYSPFPLVIEGMEDDDGGSLPSVTITVPNLSREIFDYLDDGHILDRKARIYQMTRADLTEAFDRGSWRILDAVLTDEVASFRLGPYALFDAPYPARRQARSRCDEVYGGRGCGYSTALPNLISGTYPDFDPTTCDLSIEGGNGCRVHGQNEIANGRPDRHPERFGGHPSIPKGPGRL